jgi:hypothetical protein
MLRQKNADEIMHLTGWDASARCLLFHGRLYALVPSLDFDSNNFAPESVTEVSVDSESRHLSGVERWVLILTQQRS